MATIIYVIFKVYLYNLRIISIWATNINYLSFHKFIRALIELIYNMIALRMAYWRLVLISACIYILIILCLYLCPNSIFINPTINLIRPWDLELIFTDDADLISAELPLDRNKKLLITQFYSIGLNPFLNLNNFTCIDGIRALFPFLVWSVRLWVTS